MFRDPSIGNLVRVETVKIMSLTGESFGSVRQGEGQVSATEMLTSFCGWQTRLNQYKAGPLLYDVALLVTRENICSQPGTEGEGEYGMGGAFVGDRCWGHSIHSHKISPRLRPWTLFAVAERPLSLGLRRLEIRRSVPR